MPRTYCFQPVKGEDLKPVISHMKQRAGVSSPGRARMMAAPVNVLMAEFLRDPEPEAPS